MSFVLSSAGVGLQWPLPPQNERRPGSGCGDLTGSAAKEEYTGDGMGKVLYICVFKCDHYVLLANSDKDRIQHKMCNTEQQKNVCKIKR